jgi:hypothetical protein
VRLSGLRAARQGFSTVRKRYGNSADSTLVLTARGLFVCFVQVCLSKIEVVRSEIRGILSTRRCDNSLGFADI